MNKLLVIALASFFLVGSVGHTFATNWIHECGPFHKLESGPINLISNITTSGHFYSSGTTSGTSGCSGWAINDKLRYRYVASSYQLLQGQAAEGKGQYLEGLAVLMGCSSDPFNQIVQKNYDDLFSDIEPNPQKIISSLKTIINKDTVSDLECYRS